MNTKQSTQITGPTVAEFDWDANGMQHQGLSCPRHPGTRWITKHAYARTVHYVATFTPECDCHLGDLVVED